MFLLNLTIKKKLFEPKKKKKLFGWSCKICMQNCHTSKFNCLLETVK